MLPAVHRLALFALCLLLPLALSAAPACAKRRHPPSTPRTSTPRGAGHRPAPRQHPDYSLAPEELAKAQHLSTIHVTLHFVDEAWGIVSLLLLLWLGVIAWMRNRAVKLSRTAGCRVTSSFSSSSSPTSLLSLPLRPLLATPLARLRPLRARLGQLVRRSGQEFRASAGSSAACC